MRYEHPLMAEHASALKRHRQSRKRRARNNTVKSGIKVLHKKLKAISTKAEALKLLPEMMSVYHKAAAKHVLHKNTAARRVSLVTRFVNSLS
ncbi:MAG: 30S ribosomal protein S20 [Deltaproteobacteria bacterium RIFCSPLOWO2_12_FULL_40_28]|nr:MAG: 30S ribosomal protein S20 [Deltaproteobacteria bacterium RIFCSPHIGHO2_02_FULL_40_28]OGQ18909.1 MAG: 30S ribosomal protein S20 [Deltaproteobacteria bacterium RIFCSPHIGHO2_12_FULL_40_32]OGQ40154.1 MAG: 30S ribosomal protein S20 [Deltaproteobacteria bacterium RIFCSPLOWO2_02_FULL_40_36]OGQ53337.1 MAG: 30S ribosomal protein S20 [Deltaproteobacteria bacterium RIFCSPLOWO2_12_FULL_40_28]